MNKKIWKQWDRLEMAFAGDKPDRTPILGGWICSAELYSQIAGVTEDQYWTNPEAAAVKAYQKLGMDGLIAFALPVSRNNSRMMHEHDCVCGINGMSVDEALEYIDNLPSAEEYEAKFDFETEYNNFKLDLGEKQKEFGDMVYMPAQWGASAKFQWYIDLGYENYLIIIGAYPDQARKLMEVGGAIGRQRGRIIARAVTEGIYPHAVLLGEDICTQRDTLVSPKFLEKYYAPQLKYALEPLLEVGCRPVWHSDGNINVIMDMLIDCGVQGFQGFQTECGVIFEDIIKKRTREGNRLIIFGPLAVTSELPHWSPQKIRSRVKEVIEIAKDNANLVFFTSSSIGSDVPVENVYAMYEAVMDYGKS